MKKRLISIILALAMLVGMIPLGTMTAFAENELPHTHTDAAGVTHTFKAWDKTDSLPTDGYWYLTKDVHLPNTGWNISKDVSLCLNGHVISLMKVDRTISITNKATFSLYDCGKTEHKFRKATSSYGYEYWELDEKNGTKTVTGGVITGLLWFDTTDMDAWGIKVKSGTFNMYGGNICGNYSGSSSAAPVLVNDFDYERFDACTFNMYGGSICYNNSHCAIVAIFTNDDSKRLNPFNMYGGSIYENTSDQGTIYFRGPSFVDNPHSIAIYGGEIRNNTSTFCSGVFAGGPAPVVIIGGSAVICDNHLKNGAESNIKMDGEDYNYCYFGEGKYAPQKGMHIGLSDGEWNNIEIPIKNFDTEPFYTSYLFSDDTSKYVYFDEHGEYEVEGEPFEGKIVLKPIEAGSHKINVETKGNGNVLCISQYAKQDEGVVLLATPGSEDDIVRSVKYNGEDAENRGDNYYAFAMPNEDVTVTVEFGSAQTPVDVPTAVTGLVYNSEEQTGVEEGEGYTVTNGSATNAGEYTATATLEDGYVWSDGTTDPVTINWSIAKKDVEVPDPETTFDYDGEEHIVLEDDDYYTVYGDFAAIMYGKYTATVELNDPDNCYWADEEFVGEIEWEIVDTIAEERQQVYDDLYEFIEEADPDGYAADSQFILGAIDEYSEQIDKATEDRIFEVYQVALDAIKDRQKQVKDERADGLKESYLNAVEGLDIEESVIDEVNNDIDDAENLTQANTVVKEAIAQAVDLARVQAKQSVADAAEATGIKNAAMTKAVEDANQAIDEAETIADILQAGEDGVQAVNDTAIAETFYEYYLTTAAPKADGTTGKYNQRSYYIDDEGQKVTLKDRLAEEDWTCTFAQWYLRSMIQYKMDGNDYDIRFISMLNGECFDNNKLTDYEYAGFIISIGEETFDPITTTIGYTSFLADGKDISIADYSDNPNGTDFFFLANTTFVAGDIGVDTVIKVTPFVKLMDSDTKLEGNTASFTLSQLIKN